MITLSKSQQLGEKDGTLYFKDANTGTIFCDPIDQSGKVGGENEGIRSHEHNPTRFERIMAFRPKVAADYGCGHGDFVNYCKSHGLPCDGYDPFNPEYSEPLKKNHYNVVVALEVVEHLFAPFSELQEIADALKTGGILMVESSFADWVTLKDEYVNPGIGHCTIWSHKGLDEAMKSVGLYVLKPINRNVRLYAKP